MNAVKSFSLPDEAISVLDALPKRERSSFVAKAILEAARHRAKLDALAAIESFDRQPLPPGESVVDLLRELRQH